MANANVEPAINGIPDGVPRFFGPMRTALDYERINGPRYHATDEYMRRMGHLIDEHLSK